MIAARRAARSTCPVTRGLSIPAFALAALPTVCLASDMTGIPTLIALACFVGPWSLLNLVAFVVLAFRRAYRRLRPALCHAALAAIGPAYGLCVALRDFSGRYHVADRNAAFAVIGAVFLLGCLPLVAHRWQRTRDDASRPNPLRGAP